MREGTTIAALATAPAPAGVAIIRISGPRAESALTGLFRAEDHPTREPRRLVFGELLDSSTSEVLDRCLAVYMKAPNSFTGEDVAEIHLHGSPVLVQRVLRSLYAWGIEAAQPGEFTRRAFLNGRMDLIEAEAVAEVIEAGSEKALKLASEHLEGRLSRSISAIAESCRNLLAEIEAGLDFSDQDIESQDRFALTETLTSVIAALEKLISGYSYGRLARDGFRVLICGLPNVGKSSLFNTLLGRSRAIVTEVSGTTRDLLEESFSYQGQRFVLCDSAGITETSDRVEQIGIELARERMSWADLILLVADARDTRAEWQRVYQELGDRAGQSWLIVNKIDLLPEAGCLFSKDPEGFAAVFRLSASTEEGLSGLLDALNLEVQRRQPLDNDASSVVTSERQFACLERCRSSLARARDAAVENLPFEIVSAELRLGLSALEEMTGKVWTEDILERIFSRFCIGK